MVTLHQTFLKGRKKKKHTNNLLRLQYSPQKKGVVSKVRIVSPKKPNSARRKIAKVLLSTGKYVLARIKGHGHNLQSFSRVLVTSGRARDIPGVRFTMIKGVLDFSSEESCVRTKSRSKYGISLDRVEFVSGA